MGPGAVFLNRVRRARLCKRIHRTDRATGPRGNRRGNGSIHGRLGQTVGSKGQQGAAGTQHGAQQEHGVHPPPSPAPRRAAGCPSCPPGRWRPPSSGSVRAPRSARGTDLVDEEDGIGGEQPVAQDLDGHEEEDKGPVGERRNNAAFTAMAAMASTITRPLPQSR